MRQLDKAFQWLIHALAILAGVIFSAITIALTLNVAMRLINRTSIYGMVDAIELGLMAATFLAAPWVLHKNAHVSVDIFLIGLSAPVRHRLDVAMSIFGALLSAALGWASLTALLIAFERGSMMRGVLIVPEWIPLLAPTLAGALLAIEFIRRIARGPAAERQQTGL